MATSLGDPVPAWVDREGYPFTTRFVTLPSGRMHYVDEGAGKVVLFVHGTPTWSYEWRHLIRALAPRWRCIAPDLLGFGLSDRPAGFAYTPDAHALFGHEARVVRLPAAGHWPHEEEPEAVRQEVLAFLILEAS
jgi:pimeloyl-ACP methyl ester carboxylesterase